MWFVIAFHVLLGQPLNKKKGMLSPEEQRSDLTVLLWIVGIAAFLCWIFGA